MVEAATQLANFERLNVGTQFHGKLLMAMRRELSGKRGKFQQLEPEWVKKFEASTDDSEEAVELLKSLRNRLPSRRSTSQPERQRSAGDEAQITKTE